MLVILEACFNTLAFCLMMAAWWSVKRGLISLHIKLMVAAVISSAAFLVCYVLHHVFEPTTIYQGAYPKVYYPILISHIILAAMTPVLVLRAVYLGYKRRIDDHKALVRYALPIWAYVSVTGVIIYYMVFV